MRNVFPVLNTKTIFKSILLLTMFSLTMLLFATILTKPTIALNKPMLNISILRYEPLPAVPGTVMDVWLSVQNTGDETARDVVVEFVNTTIFNIYNDEITKHIGALQPDQEATVHYKVLISRNAVLGINYLKIKYTPNQATGYWFKQQLPISIEIRTPELIITEQKTIPETIAPSQKGVLFLKLSNKGDTLLKDISLQLNIDKEYVCSSSVSSYCQLVEQPIALIDTSTKTVIQSLRPGETAELKFKFIADNNAEIGVYKIPITVSFYDEDGNQHKFNDYATIIINSKPDIIANIENLEPTNNGFRVTISFSNPTISVIKFLTVSIDSNMRLSIPIKQYYIGNIDPDDDESIDLEFKILKAQKQSENLKLDIKAFFKDEFNNPYEKTFNITIPYEDIPSKISNSKSWIIIFLIIIAIIVLIVLNKKRKNRKRKNKK